MALQMQRGPFTPDRERDGPTLLSTLPRRGGAGAVLEGMPRPDISDGVVAEAVTSLGRSSMKG